MTCKIVLIDDDSSFRSLVKDDFLEYDCEILEADSSKYGMALAIDKRPDLIILDAEMPEITGEEIVLKLKKRREIRDVPIFVITDEAEQNKVLRFAKLGIKGYFVKPLKGDELVAKASALLNLQPKQANKPADPAADDKIAVETGDVPLDEDYDAYFSIEEDIRYIHLPEKVTKRFAEGMEANLHPKIVEMTNRGIRKLILDLRKVEAINIHLIKIAVIVTKKCRVSHYLFQVVASPNLAEELQQFSELTEVPFEKTIEDAKEALALI